MKAKKNKKKHAFIPISELARRLSINRQTPRYWIEQGADSKGRKLRWKKEFGRIFISEFHTT